MLFYPDAGQVIDLTAKAGAQATGLVYSTVGVVALGGNLFAYGTNQKGDLIEYAFSPGGASASVRRVPTPPGNRDTMVFQDVSAIVAGNIRHVFATDGASRLVHFAINPDGTATAENVTELTKGTATGYSAYQQPFAGRVYSGVTPVLAPDGTLFVYGTNGRDLVEFQRSPNGSWQTTDLTNRPANRVFGNPTAYVLPNGDRHILQINEEGEVVEYYKLAGLDFATYNITLALGNNTGSPNPGFPNTLPGSPQGPNQGPSDDHANLAGFGATPLAFDSSGTVASASGAIGAANDRDVFKFVATRRGRIVIELTARDRKLDTVLRVLNGRVRTIAMNDNGGRRTNSRVVLNVVAGQTYYVEVRGKGGTLGRYNLFLRTIGRLQRRPQAAQSAGFRKSQADLGTASQATPSVPSPLLWAAHWSRARKNDPKA